jgi:hypothetical protein
MRVTAGVDWAKDDHVVCVVGDQGEALERFTVRHDAAGLRQKADQLLRWASRRFLTIPATCRSSTTTVPNSDASRAVSLWRPTSRIPPRRLQYKPRRQIVIGTFVWHAVYFFNLTSFLDAQGPRPWTPPRPFQLRRS